MSSEYIIPVPRMTDNIVVAGKYVYLSPGMRRIYVYDRTSPAIGSGGMGRVYRGLDCKDQSAVAIKQLHPKLCSVPWLRKRTREESALTFSHPNIVEMLGCCEFRNAKGPMFVISKYVLGKNSDEYVRALKSFQTDEERSARIIKILLPLFDALDFLHQQNIRHLDIKPSNIMIDQFSTAKLMDLGVANSTTNTGSFGFDEFCVLGTPSFAAPEQFIIPGEQSHVDGRSDLYELAVTIFKLICDVNPYETPSLADTYKLHKSCTLHPHINLPDRIYQVLAKATEPSPSDRYCNAMDFKQALINAIEPRRKRKFGIF